MCAAALGQLSGDALPFTFLHDLPDARAEREGRSGLGAGPPRGGAVLTRWHLDTRRVARGHRRPKGPSRPGQGQAEESPGPRAASPRRLRAVSPGPHCQEPLARASRS